jgi:MFS family permease
LSGSPNNRGALTSLILARIVYAINWLNIGPVYVLMQPDLRVGISGLGTLTAAFYLGLGLMQIPGGILAAVWGQKKTVTLGVFLSSLSVLGTSVFSDVNEIAALRFIVGMGMAFVFAPGVVMVSKLLGGKKSGMGVGLFSSAYDFGGVLGIFGWVVIAVATQWRLSIALGGALGVVSGILVIALVPPDGSGSDFRVETRKLLGILTDRRIVLLGFGTLGFGVGNIVISAFMVEYLGRTQGISPTLAGLIDSLVVIVPIFTSIWGGRIYDRAKRPRLIMALALLGSSAALAIGSVPSLYAAVASSAFGGLVSGVGYTIAFAGAKDLNRFSGEYDSLAIGWVNSISLTGSFVVPIFYSYVVETAGYSQAWLASAAFSLVFLVPLLLSKEGFGR